MTAGTAQLTGGCLDDTPVEIEVRQPAGGEQPRLAVTVRGRRFGVRIRDAVRDAITHMLMNDNEAVAQLTQLRGVGRWTAEYRNHLAEWLGHPQPLDYDGVKRAVARWQPYAGLVYFHLLLAGLTESGEMTKQNQQLPKIA